MSRILITCHSYYPKNDGVQFVTQYLAEGLVQNGNKVTVITNNPLGMKLAKEEVVNGVKIIRVDLKTVHTFHVGDKKCYLELVKEECKRHDVMINVCTQCATTDLVLSYLDKIPIKKILYLHSIWDFKYSIENFGSLSDLCSKIFANIRWRVYYFINSKNFKKYDVVTQLHEMDYSNYYFKNKLGINSEIIQNAAEDCFFEKSINKKIDLPTKYILNVSNYTKRKNQERCLKLFLKAQISEEYELILIGSKKNKYYEKLVKIYNNYKKNNKNNKVVHILAEIDRQEIPLYVRNASLYLMTSKWEAFPISIIEALASGVPFISTNVGIIRFLDGGVVCEKDEEFYYWLNKFTKNLKVRDAYSELALKCSELFYKKDEKIKDLEYIIKKLEENVKHER